MVLQYLLPVLIPEVQNRIMTSYDGYIGIQKQQETTIIDASLLGIPFLELILETLIVVSQHTGSGTSRITTSNLSCKNSIAIGTNATTGGENCLAIGNGSSTGKYYNSVALGNGATVGNHNRINIGDGSQYVGIGVSNPSYKLQVSRCTSNEYKRHF